MTEMKYFNIKRGLQLSATVSHTARLRSKAKFGKKKGELEDCVQMVRGPRFFFKETVEPSLDFYDDRITEENISESDSKCSQIAADEKIWQSFENLKEVVNNPRY